MFFCGPLGHAARGHGAEPPPFGLRKPPIEIGGHAREVRLGTGTLYGIVNRLLANGLIVEVRRRAGRDEGDRRLYARTPFGREVAKAEAARLHKLVAAARSASLIARSS